MEEIAGLAGLSKPTLYKLFSSKLDLYLVVLQTASERLVRGVSEALCWTNGLASTQTTPATAIAAAYFDFVDDHPQFSAVLFDTPEVEEPSVQWTTQRGRMRCVDVVFTAIASQTTWEPQRSHLLAVGLVGPRRHAHKSGPRPVGRYRNRKQSRRRRGCAGGVCPACGWNARPRPRYRYPVPSIR